MLHKGGLGDKVRVVSKVSCGLRILRFSGPFNLASGGFLALV